MYVFKNWDIFESFFRVVFRWGYFLSEVKEGRFGDYMWYDNVILRFYVLIIVVVCENSIYSFDWYILCFGRDMCKCRLN